MAWGQVGARGIEDLVCRIADNDAKLTSLTILRQRRFNHDDVASLVRGMATNTNLTELYCSSHPLASQTASLLADLLASSPNLRSLCVGDSSLGDDGVTALARGIAKSHLTQLDLTNKGLGPRGAEALSAALSSAVSLTHLLLNANPQLADAGLRALCNVGGGSSPCSCELPPSRRWSALRVLELQDCQLTALGVQALAESLGGRQLHVLRLDGNPLGAEGGGAVRELLASALQLRSLHLRGTALGDQGGRQVAEGLQLRLAGSGGSSREEDDGYGVRSPLDYLDLADCGIGSGAVAALRDAFAFGAQVGGLSLADNPAVADADVAALGEVLRQRRPAAVGEHQEVAEADGSDESAPPRLTQLDVSGTAAGPKAVSALCWAAGLRQLSLVGCPLGSAGASALVASLRAHSSQECAEGGGACWLELRELCVSGAGLSGDDLEAIFRALGAGGAPLLQSLETGANPGTQAEALPEQVEALRAARPTLAVYWRSGDEPHGVSRGE